MNLIAYLNTQDDDGVSIPALAKGHCVKKSADKQPGAHSVTGLIGTTFVIDEFHYKNHKNVPTKCFKSGIAGSLTSVTFLP